MTIDFCFATTLAHALDDGIDPDFIVPIIAGVDIDSELQQSLRKLEKQIPDWKDQICFNKWQEEKLSVWTENFRSLITEYRNIGHDWQFSKQQKELLQQYYEANELLIECLHSDCYVSSEVRQQIEDTLLLPIAEIKQRQQQS
ncbi:MAG: hypothetical protein V7K38_02480 [Nostoc sp.]|uniref:NACHT C-terminal helical domain 2-containing protein n=1 Tax=Nostoc sp. TaxID=1180 RepID=UPI002FF53467